MIRRILSSTAAAVLAAGSLGLCRAAAGPLETLRERDRQIHAILEEQKQGVTPANTARLRQAVNAALDYETHAQQSFGRYWQQLSGPERQEALRLVSTLLERSALDKVNEFAAEKIQYVSESFDAGGAAATVLTRVKRGSDTFEIGYRMERAGAAWRIVDILVEGASSVESNRGAFSREIRASGVRGLLEKLRKKAERSRP
jgi:phospholipid transport system substrate-binding protein